MAKNSVSLRNEREENYVRIITASYNADGDLIIAGHDLGDRVQTFFACSEYEYAWAIRAVHLPKLKRALGNPDNLLECSKR